MNPRPIHPDYVEGYLDALRFVGSMVAGMTGTRLPAETVLEALTGAVDAAEGELQELRSALLDAQT